MLFLLLFLLSLLTGIYSAVVGGAALLLIPVLTILGFPITSVIATMRLAATADQLVTVVAFQRKGVVTWAPALWVSLFAIPGALIGAQLVVRVPERTLAYVVAGIMILLVIIMPDIKKKVPKGKKEHPYWHMLSAALGLLLGIYGGFYGAAFSTFIMVMFVMLAGFNLMTSSANASVVAFLMSLSASYIFWKSNLIDWHLFWPIATGGAIGSWIGVDLAAKFGFRWVRGLIFVVMLLSVVKLLFFP